MRIAVLGAGYAGLTLARRLKRTLPAEHEIVVVNDSPAHLVQHEIHRVIRRPAIADDIVVPLTDVLERARIEVARVECVDPDAKTVTLANIPGSDRSARAYDGDDTEVEDTGIDRAGTDRTGGIDGIDGIDETSSTEIEIKSADDTGTGNAASDDAGSTDTASDDAESGSTGTEGIGSDETETEATESTLDYDICAVCLGAETDFQDVPGIIEHATPLKRLPDAERIRADFLSLLPEGGRVVVCGAGLSGIQVAGELAALAREEGRREAVEIVLTEALDRVAPAFSEEFGRAVRAELEEHNVRIRTNAPVERATDEGIVVDGEDLPADQLIWTGGIRGPEALDGERPVVKNTLQFGENTFVLGDAARVVDASGEAVPASAQSAVREARAVAENIATIVDSENAGGFRPRLSPFDFDSPGWLVSVGDGAVARVGPTVLRGTPAKALKTTVGAGYLTSVGAIRNAVDLAREELSGSN